MPHQQNSFAKVSDWRCQLNPYKFPSIWPLHETLKSQCQLSKFQSRIKAALRLEVERNLNGRSKTATRKQITL